MNKNTLLIGLGVIVLILVLVGLPALNRTEDDFNMNEIQPNIEGEFNEVVDNVSDSAEDAENAITMAALQAQLETRLLAIEEGLQAETVTDETINEIQDLRSDMQELYEETNAETQSLIDQVDAVLDQVELNARENTAAALTAVQELLLRVQQEEVTVDNVE